MKIIKNRKSEYRRKQAQILNVIVDSTSKARVLSQVREKMAKRQKFYIVTPNPEIVMIARHDKLFRSILNEANIKLPDGIGLAAAHRFLYLPNPKNRLLRLPVVIFQGLLVGLAVIFNRDWLFSDFKIIKGREFFLDLMKLANKRNWRVFLFGSGAGVAEKTAKILSGGLKSIKIEYAQGLRYNKNALPISTADKSLESQVIEKINQFKPHLLFVALGAPKQEKWLYRHFQNLNIGGAMVVGGTFDYVSDRISLPPRWIEKAGFEWFWRLITQPKRIGRIFTATIIFPLSVFWEKLHQDL